MFISSFGHQVLKDRKAFNMTPVGDVKYTQNADITSHHSLLIEAPYEPRPNVTYMINVFVIDDRGCTGPETNYTFTSELNFLHQQKSWVMWEHMRLGWGTNYPDSIGF